jgi:hypothetical protein
MGFIEETGAAQHLRDARITSIYEGTTGIQAADLVGRKIARDGGRAIQAVLSQIQEVVRQLRDRDSQRLASLASSLSNSVASLERAVDFVVSHFESDVRDVSVGAVPLLQLFGIVAGGWQLARSALAAQRRLDGGDPDAGFLQAKLSTALFYADNVLCQSEGLSHSVIHGAAAALGVDDDQF